MYLYNIYTLSLYVIISLMAISTVGCIFSFLQKFTRPVSIVVPVKTNLVEIRGGCITPPPIQTSPPPRSFSPGHKRQTLPFRSLKNRTTMKISLSLHLYKHCKKYSSKRITVKFSNETIIYS